MITAGSAASSSPPGALGLPDVLDGLTETQHRAVVSEARPLCVLASAGAGKTRVLTRRIAYRTSTGTADPAHVLALTFTRKAAGELSDRLRLLGLRDRVATGTFHALAMAQLRGWWADRGQCPPVVLDRKSRILGPLLTERPALAGVALAEIAAQIEWAKARLIRPDELPSALLAAGRSSRAPAAELAAVYERYEHEKTRRGLLDFDDLLARAADAIDHDPSLAASQRWRWRHVFVDEFQDVNPLQHRLLLAWLGDSTDLCIVGDPNQAIYGWNGADPELLAGVPDRWPSTEIVRLDANHRCSPQIVAAAAAVLGASAGTLTSSRPDGPSVTVDAWPTATAEAHAVAAAVRRARQEGSTWSQLAILVRTNAQAVPLAEACRAAGIPVRTPGSAALLDQPAARAALDELRRRPGAPLRVAIGDLDQWAADPARPDADRPDDPGGLSGRVGISLGPTPGGRAGTGPGAAGDPDAASTLAALAELARHAHRIDESMQVGAWLAWLPVMLGRDRDDTAADAVTVCSFHRAKGLEWSAVWVCGLEAGLVPIGQATTAAAVAEERRLLYVALTRAGRDLHCSWAEERSFGHRPFRRDPSPWLGAIQAQLDPDDQGPGGRAVTGPAEWQRRLTAQRDELRSHSARMPRPSRRTLPPGWAPPDAGVLDALRSWRADTARASGVPSHVVLHDTILVALAALRPRDEDALLEVPGLGPVKASRYGPTLLALVADQALTA